MPDTRLLLLDGHSMAYRAFYALPVENFSTTTGQPTNAVYGFTSMLINVLRDEKPTHVIVAFDISKATFRLQAFPEYKATRAKSPPEFAPQIELIREVLDTLDITVVGAEGYEADDVIATLVRKSDGLGMSVDIVTGDRDSFQLVDDRVTVLYPRKGVSDLARMTPAAVVEKYDLTPQQYPDFAALRGDPSDNLPGIPGVGEKTAAKWIREFGSLAGLVDHVDEIGGKVGDSLRAGLAQVLVNSQLTRLVDDVPLDTDVLSCELKPWNNVKVGQLFDTLQFTALRDRLAKVRPSGIHGGVDMTETPVAETPEALRDARWSVVDAARLWERRGPVAVAVEGSWGSGTGEIRRIAVVGADGAVAVCPASAKVLDWLASADHIKNMHDAKGPAVALLATGRSLAGLRYDTALTAYVDSPGDRGFSLSDVALRVLGRELSATQADGMLTFDESANDGELASAAIAIRDLVESLEPRLIAKGQAELLDGVEIPLVQVLATMEHAGIAVDVEGLTALSVEFLESMRDSEERAQAIVGKSFNLGSPKQLQEILFIDRGLPKTKKIKTGFTTDAESLQQLFARTGDPLLEQILAWRDRAKLRQTVDGLIPLVDSSGRIHTTFNQMVAATGRLSSTEPNLQNIPVRTEAGRRIRECFVVGAGYESLMTADYSQIEMRIMAHLSDDAGLIAAFHSGEDLHTTVASTVFGVARDDVDADMRRKIKAMSYGLAYGLSPYGLSQQLDISPDEARRLMDDYFLRFGGVRAYLADVVERARMQGYTSTMLGRRRFLPDLTSDNRQRREMAERMALNAPIQGTAADIVKVSMLAVDADLRRQGLKSRLLLQVHDELVLEVAPGERESLEALVRDAMGRAADLSVPLDVSVGVGASWHEAAH